MFAFNGIGSYLFDAISTLDFAVLQGFILFIAVVYALVNLVVDLGYGVIDPTEDAVIGPFWPYGLPVVPPVPTAKTPPMASLVRPAPESG